MHFFASCRHSIRTNSISHAHQFTKTCTMTSRVSVRIVKWQSITVTTFLFNWYIPHARHAFINGTQQISSFFSQRHHWTCRPLCYVYWCSATFWTCSCTLIPRATYARRCVRVVRYGLRKLNWYKWNTGETLTESLYQLDSIRRTKDAMAAWRVLIATITDQLRLTRD